MNTTPDSTDCPAETLEGGLRRMYCIKCRYSLFGLTSPRCPECGQPFDPNDPTTYLTTDRVVHPVHMVIGFAIVGVMLVLAAASGGQLDLFVDPAMLIWFAGVLVGGLWMCFGPLTTIRAFVAAAHPARVTDRDTLATHLLVLARAYQLAWAAGLIGMLIGLFIMLSNMGDPSMIGSGMAMGLLPVLYAAVLAEFIFAPLQQALASRSGLAAFNMPLLAVPHRSVQAVAFAVVFAALLVLLIMLMGRMN